jgi:hypothetical protein
VQVTDDALASATASTVGSAAPATLTHPSVRRCRCRRGPPKTALPDLRAVRFYDVTLKILTVCIARWFP